MAIGKVRLKKLLTLAEVDLYEAGKKFSRAAILAIYDYERRGLPKSQDIKDLEESMMRYIDAQSAFEREFEQRWLKFKKNGTP